MKALLLGSLLAAAACAGSELVAPRWKIQLVDEAGVPAQGVTVVESWYHQTYECVPHDETRVTDASGAVIFPPRYLSEEARARPCPILKDRGIHTGYGPHAFVLVDVRDPRTGFPVPIELPRSWGKEVESREVIPTTWERISPPAPAAERAR